MTREQIKDAMFDELYESEMDELEHICETPAFIQDITAAIPDNQIESLNGKIKYFADDVGNVFAGGKEYSIVNVIFLFEHK